MCDKWNPRSVWYEVAFDDPMRHELGSKAGFYPAVISRDEMQVVDRYSVILGINNLLTILLLGVTVKQSSTLVPRDLLK